jgi:hypothetical protein
VTLVVSFDGQMFYTLRDFDGATYCLCPKYLLNNVTPVFEVLSAVFFSPFSPSNPNFSDRAKRFKVEVLHVLQF